MLDLSGFSSDLPLYGVAKMVYKRFEGSSSVQSIQFVPGKNVQITFKDSKTKESIVKHEYITINDVRCAVVGGGPKVQNVLIHHYPFEEDNHRLWIASSSFGEVRDIQYQHYPDLCSISTGTRVVLTTLVPVEMVEIHLSPVRLMWEDTCVRRGMSGNLLNAIFVKMDMFPRTALLRVNVDGV